MSENWREIFRPKVPIWMSYTYRWFLKPVCWVRSPGKKVWLRKRAIKKKKKKKKKKTHNNKCWQRHGYTGTYFWLKWKIIQLICKILAFPSKTGEKIKSEIGVHFVICLSSIWILFSFLDWSLKTKSYIIYLFVLPHCFWLNFEDILSSDMLAKI